MEQEYIIKVSDELVQLIDQNEHIKILPAKNLAVKLVMKWVYDEDVLKLTDLQAKQIKVEKEMYEVEDQIQ